MEITKKISILLLFTCVATGMNAQFLGTNNLYYEYANNEKTELKVVSGGTPYTGNIIIPEEAQITDTEIVESEQTITLPVTVIGASAFSGATGLISISIPASVKEIGTSAFYSCNNLAKAIFNSVNDFCNTTFGNKEANPLYYAHHLYVDNNEVTVIDVPAGPVEISAGAFAGGSEITKITIPESIQSIGTDAFYGCNNNNLTISYATETQMKTMNYGKGESNPMSKAKMFLVGGQEITEVSFDADVHESGFKGAAWLQKITLNPGVTKIGDEAFLGCNKLTTVICNGTDITEIGNNAFNNCQKLSIVKLSENQEKNELPASLESLGRSAFRYCINLKNITIPNSVTSIGKETFYSCSGLLEVDLQADITTIPESMFNGCTKLSQVTLSSSIKTVDFRAFYGCSALTGLPNVTTIGQEAYANCKGFTTLTLPTTITSIGEKAFAYCNNITDLMIPEDVSGLSISVQAFYVETGMGSLKRIYSYPTTAPGAHATAFEGQTGIQLFYSAGGTGYDQEPWINFNPAIFQEQTITWYEDNNTGDNFYHQELVQVGQPIPIITDPTRDGWTFAGWQWPDDNVLTLMPNYPLELRGYFTAKKNHNTTGITYKLRSDNKQAIVVEDENVNSNIESVVIGPSVAFDNINYTIVAIDARAFKGAKKLTSADISNATLTSIGKAVFADCSALETVKLPNQATEIPDSLFFGCEELTTMDIPAGIISIGAYAFNTCSVYNNVEFPSTLKVIGESAFTKSGILEITLPKNIETIGQRVFSNCAKLEKFVFAEDMQLTTLPDNAFQGCSKLKSITLPSSMKTIGAAAFLNCTSMKQLVLDETSIQTISSNAFFGCTNLKEITLPASISSLGDNAFGSCNSIVQITINTSEPPSVASTAFTDNVISNASLYVTDDSKYNAHAFWKQFSPRILTVKESTLTYMVDGIVFGEIKTLKTGMLIETNDISVHPNYATRQFSGWDNEPQVMPNEDVVVTGAFEYKLTYKDADAENPEDVLLTVNLYYGDKVVNPQELTKQGFRYDITNSIENMPAEDIILNVKYFKTETDHEYNGLNYHIYTEGNNPHAELIAGNTPYTGDIIVPATITYMNDEDVYPVTAIRANAFKDCFNMTSVSMPESITSIGTQAFTGCYKLVEITIPKNVETLGTEVFLRCSGLKEVYFNNESKLESLPSNTFMGCKALETIDLHSSLKTISSYVFMGCSSLKEIAIPESVTSIGEEAFKYCEKLEKITIENQTALPAASDNTFEANTYDVATLVVSATVQAHLTSPWNNFFNVDLGGETAQKCATPKIIYDKGTLKFECDTPGAEIKSEITVSDAIKTNGPTEYTQLLNKKYVIKAYATAFGYKRSDVKEASIVWRNGLPILDDGFKSVELGDTEQQGVPGDMNADGQVTAEDAALILKTLVGNNN